MQRSNIWSYEPRFLRQQNLTVTSCTNFKKGGFCKVSLGLFARAGVK